jgi:hypothetical protein
MTYLGIKLPEAYSRGGSTDTIRSRRGGGWSEMLEDMTRQELEAEIGSGGATTASAGSATTARSR